MKSDDVFWLREQLEKLPFVKWDRYIWVQSEPNVMRLFGWIDREDLYKDFVVFEFVFEEPYNRAFFIQTSSAKYSQEISDIFEEEHIQCHKIDEVIKRDACLRGGND